MRSMDDLTDVGAFYRHFAEREAKGESRTFERWAAGVAEDPEVRTLLEELPVAKRQPNLVFAAARWHGALAHPTGPGDPDRPDDHADLRAVLVGQWPAVRETILTRSTQTNEVGRCATLLPLLAGLPGPLALVEVGASAGLCLHPDRWSYRYVDDGGEEVARLDPSGGPSEVVLDCTVRGPVPLPPSLPEVVHRGGVDLNPLDLTLGDDATWLETLVWPEHEDRRARLATACRVVAGAPVDLVRGDLLTGLDEAIARARAAAPEATVVVFHSAVIAYLDEDGRDRWPGVITTALEQVRASGGARALDRQRGARGPARGGGDRPVRAGGHRLLPRARRAGRRLGPRPRAAPHLVLTAERCRWPVLA